MIKNLSIILFILALSYVNASPEVASFGHSIPIVSIDRAMYVLVDLTYNGVKSYPMGLSLHSSETVIMNNVLGFAPYNCYLPDCSRTGSFWNIETADLVYQGERVHANVYLNYNVWFFTNYDSYRPVLADRVVKGGNLLAGKGYAGIIGMGAAKNGRQLPPVFSIYIHKIGNGTTGNLIFGNDVRFAESNVTVTTLAADENWHVANGTMMRVGGNQPIIPSEPFKVIFDINNDFILIPHTYVSQWTNLFWLAGFTCSMNNYHFTCRSSYTINRLPTIVLNMSGNAIRITPNIYVHPEDYNPSAVASNIRTIFQFTAPYSDIFYISPSYINYILLGRTFMKEYYTVFDSQAKQIKLYVATSTPPSQPQFDAFPSIPPHSEKFQRCAYKCHEKEARCWTRPHW